MAKYSAQALRLLEVLSSKDFRRIEEGFRKRFSGGIEVVSLDGNEVRKLCSGNCHPQICELIRGSRPGKKRCRQERKRSINIALQTGTPHISLCHAGVVLGCVPVINGDEAIGGVFFGKWLWEEFDEKVHLELMRRLSGLRIRDDLVWFAGKELGVVSARRTCEAADFLYVLLYEITGFSPRVSNEQREHFHEHTDLADSRKIGLEKRLICRLKTGDLDGEKMKRLKPAIEFMNLFYGQEISLANIAQAAGLSVGRLCHLFKEQTNLTVIEYLTDVRIEYAKKLLLRTDKNCSAICHEIGYKNQSYFTKVFTEVVGVSPGVFRKRAPFWNAPRKLIQIK